MTAWKEDHRKHRRFIQQSKGPEADAGMKEMLPETEIDRSSGGSQATGKAGAKVAIRVHL